MEERVSGPGIKAMQSSYFTGERVGFCVRDLQLSTQDSCSVDIGRVESDSTEWAAGFSIPVTPTTRELVIQAPTNLELPPGIYVLMGLSFCNSASEEPRDLFRLAMDELDPCLFQVHDESQEALSEQQLISEYDAINAARDLEFASGFGIDGSRQYLGLVFVKDCLMTRRMRLARYELIPFQGLPCGDELGVVQSFLAQFGLDDLDNVSGVVSAAQHGQPTVVIHFPRILADSVDEAGRLAEDEVSTLGNLLTVHRNSYASVFATVLVDLQSGQKWFRILYPNYRGNLLGGAMSGETSSLLRRGMERARADFRLQLYLALYKEAQKETRLEFQYFRYWNLLETIGSSRGFVGQPLRDWAGNSVFNRKGHQRSVQDGAEQIVSELLRTELNGNNQLLASGLAQGLMTQMIPIWYRHRNCVVHGGGCIDTDPGFCDRSKDKYVNCKSAHDEIVRAQGVRDSFTDGYLRALREAVGLVIRKELV